MFRFATHYYKPKVLLPGELKRAFEQSAASVLGQEFEISAVFVNDSNDATTELSLGGDSLIKLTDLSNIYVKIRANAKNGDSLRVSCDNCADTFRMGVVDEPSLRCLNALALYLGLERTRPKDPIQGPLDDFDARLKVLEQAFARSDRRLKCFISFKFDDTGTANQVARLKRFLSALDVEWVSAEQFEPRRIEDKVRAKLRADVDFVVAVISKAGRSEWIRDELGDANARGLCVVVLVENAASFEQGIFGSLEYIKYDAAIDQCFLEILEAVNFIKAEHKGTHSA